MTDRAELRRLAEASLKAEETWHHEADLHGSLACTYGESGDYFVEQDAAFIAAASPDVVLGLLDQVDELTKKFDHAMAMSKRLMDERDQLRAVAKRLREALVKLACLGNGNLPGNSHGNIIAQQALSDPEVENL